MDLLHSHSLPADLVPQWPLWITAAGVVLFCLLGLYAAALLVLGRRAPGALRFLQPATLRGRITAGLVTASVLPAVSLALVLTERTADERLARNASLLQGQATEIARTADQFLARNRAALVSLAQHLTANGSLAADGAGAVLLQYHRAHPQFTMLYALRGDSVLVSATALLNGQPVPVPADSIAPGNRARLGAALEAGPAHVLLPESPDGRADVLLGVPVAGPGGQRWGAVGGTLDTAPLAGAERALATRIGAGVLLLDGAGRIVSDAAPPGGRALTAGAVAQLVAAAQAHAGAEAFRVALNGGGDTLLVSSRRLDNGWRTFIYTPLDVVTNALLTEYAVAAGWLCLALAIGLGLAVAIARNIAGPLDALDRAMTGFEIDIDRQMPGAPPGAPREIHAVFDHLATLVDGLRDSYRKLRHALKQGEKLRGELIYVIANREKEIEQRTRELQEANETLQRISRTDTVTGLANRRCLAEFLIQAWRLGQRNQRPMSVLVLDIDDFKAYNDRWGHQQGDECLHAVAAVIEAAVSRPTDLASRYGGEEFVVVLGDTPLEGALQVAERIRREVAGLRLEHADEQPVRVTVSIGVCSTLPTRTTQPETVLVAADHAMYKAKRNGKNQVAYSTPTHTGIFQALCLPGQAESRLS